MLENQVLKIQDPIIMSTITREKITQIASNLYENKSYQEY